MLSYSAVAKGGRDVVSELYGKEKDVFKNYIKHFKAMFKLFLLSKILLPAQCYFQLQLGNQKKR